MDLTLPFDARTDVIATHCPGVGSHSWQNAFFAIDLAHPDSQPAATVVAASDGTAYVFGAEDGTPCAEPPGTPDRSDDDRCGQGWGNRVKIHHGGGVVSFYVHLDHALVTTGQQVRRGDPIGVEGWTGQAGHRHLHFSVQRIPGASLAEWEAHMDWAGESIPYSLRVRQGAATRTVDATTLRCPHVGVEEADRRGVPIWRGVDPGR